MKEFTFVHDGRTVRCWVESIHVTASGHPAIPPNAMWYYEIDGVTRSAGEAGVDDQQDDVQRVIITYEESGKAREGVWSRVRRPDDVCRTPYSILSEASTRSRTRQVAGLCSAPPYLEGATARHIRIK